jgi:hypothetical protein
LRCFANAAGLKSEHWRLQGSLTEDLIVAKYFLAQYQADVAVRSSNSSSINGNKEAHLHNTCDIVKKVRKVGHVVRAGCMNDLQQSFMLLNGEKLARFM